MRYKELMEGIPFEILQEGAEKEITSLEYDSRKVTPGACCVCESGLVFDGTDFLQEDKEKGAVLAVMEKEPKVRPEGLMLLKVKSVREAMPRMAANFYAGCLDKIRLIGLTGTNGKTTTSTLIHHVMMNQKRLCGLIGTNENKIGIRVQPATHTTPLSFDLYKIFYQMQEEKVSDVVMEVSSHALHQHRVDGVRFELAMFTNLSQDHLDYHKTMEEYLQAKCLLFKQSNLGLVNGDDPAAVIILQEAKCPCFTFGLREENDFSARNVVMCASGLEYDWYFKGKQLAHLRYPVPGRFNVYNTLAAASACYLQDVAPEAVAEALDIEEPIVAGRFQAFYSEDGVTAIVDYAHTPDGLENVLETVQEFAQGRIITLFGCGGDRDAAKRPIMGKIAGEKSDFCIITSDNPRTEDPEKIMEQIEEGMRETQCPYEKVADRRAAILQAVLQAESGDVIMIAGKGHEDYQIIGREKIHLDDREEVKKAIQLRQR